MSHPRESGARADRRDTRRDAPDASVTASLPAVTADRSDATTSESPYPQGGMPGAESRDPWKGTSSRTETVPSVATGPAGAGAAAASASATSARPSFGDQLPPRPGATGTGRPATSAVASRPDRGRTAVKPARRAQLTLRRFNVWSVFKFSCMLAIALWLVWMIAVGVLYGILDGAGVVGSLNNVYSQLQGSGSGALVRPGQVLGIAAIIGVVNIVLFIALSSLFAVIYNLVSDFVGGVEVTLSERE